MPSIVPANRLYKGTYRNRNSPTTWFTDQSLEKVLDPSRLESNVRSVRFPIQSSATDEVKFAHDAGEKPVAVVLSGFSIPSGASGTDIKIEVKSADDKEIVMTVQPADKGIGVSITALFQTAGLCGEA